MTLLLLETNLSEKGRDTPGGHSRETAATDKLMQNKYRLLPQPLPGRQAKKKDTRIIFVFQGPKFNIKQISLKHKSYYCLYFHLDETN